MLSRNAIPMESSLLAKSSGSWLGDQSVQKAGTGATPACPCPSVPRLCGYQHPCRGHAFTLCVLGALPNATVLASRSYVPVGNKAET